jgi:hypothetical protein
MAMDNIGRPILESYWVEPGHLLAGEYPGGYDQEQARQRIDALVKAGFNTFIDLTEPNELLPYVNILKDQARAHQTDIKYQRFPIRDAGLPSREQMSSILDMINAELQAGRKIYLHCWGGIGRTGTTVGCYLVRGGKTGEEALSQLAEWWKSVPKSFYHSRSPETYEQANFIRNWAEHDAKFHKTDH